MSQERSTVFNSPFTSTSSSDTLMGVIAFAVFFTNSLFPALLPGFANEFHVSSLELEWLVPGFSMTYALATLLYGIVADRVGRTTLLKPLLCIAATAIFVTSFAGTPKQLIAIRTISGLSIGGLVTISLSIVGDEYPFFVQGRPMGRMFGAIATGMGLGVSLGPMASALIGWRWTLRATSVALIAAAYLVWELDRRTAPSRHHRKSSYSVIEEYKRVLDARRGKRTLLFIMANGIFHGGLFAWLGVLAGSRFKLGEAGIGFVLIGYGVPDLIIGALIGGWADRYGRRFVVPGGFLWAACCAAAVAFSRRAWMMALSVAALSIGFDATHPLMASITTSLDPKHRGQLTGLATFANFMGMSIGALAFGHLLLRGPSVATLTFSGFEFLFGLVAIASFWSERPKLLH